MDVRYCEFFFKFIFEIERERERERGVTRTSRGGAEREGDRESQAGSSLTVWRPMWGSNSQTERS